MEKQHKLDVLHKECLESIITLVSLRRDSSRFSKISESSLEYDLLNQIPIFDKTQYREFIKQINEGETMKALQLIKYKYNKSIIQELAEINENPSEAILIVLYYQIIIRIFCSGITLATDEYISILNLLSKPNFMNSIYPEFISNSFCFLLEKAHHTKNFIWNNIAIKKTAEFFIQNANLTNSFYSLLIKFIEIVFKLDSNDHQSLIQNFLKVIYQIFNESKLKLIKDIKNHDFLLSKFNTYFLQLNKYAILLLAQISRLKDSTNINFYLNELAYSISTNIQKADSDQFSIEFQETSQIHSIPFEYHEKNAYMNLNYIKYSGDKSISLSPSFPTNFENFISKNSLLILQLFKEFLEKVDPIHLNAFFISFNHELYQLLHTNEFFHIFPIYLFLLSFLNKSVKSATTFDENQAQITISFDKIISDNMLTFLRKKTNVKNTKNLKNDSNCKSNDSNQINSNEKVDFNESKQSPNDLNQMNDIHQKSNQLTNATNDSKQLKTSTNAANELKIVKSDVNINSSEKVDLNSKKLIPLDISPIFDGSKSCYGPFLLDLTTNLFRSFIVHLICNSCPNLLLTLLEKCEGYPFLMAEMVSRLYFNVDKIIDYIEAQIDLDKNETYFEYFISLISKHEIALKSLNSSFEPRDAFLLFYLKLLNSRLNCLSSRQFSLAFYRLIYEERYCEHILFHLNRKLVSMESIPKECLSQISNCSKNCFLRNIIYDMIIKTVIHKPILLKNFEGLVAPMLENLKNNPESKSSFDCAISMISQFSIQNDNFELTTKYFLILAKSIKLCDYTTLFNLIMGQHSLSKNSIALIKRPCFIPLLMIFNSDLSTFKSLYKLAEYSEYNSVQLHNGKLDFIILNQILNGKVNFNGFEFRIQLHPIAYKLIKKITKSRIDSKIVNLMIEIVLNKQNAQILSILTTNLIELRNEPIQKYAIGTLNKFGEVNNLTSQQLNGDITFSFYIKIDPIFLHHSTSEIVLISLKDSKKQQFSIVLQNNTIYAALDVLKTRTIVSITTKLPYNQWTRLVIHKKLDKFETFQDLERLQDSEFVQFSFIGDLHIELGGFNDLNHHIYNNSQVYGQIADFRLFQKNTQQNLLNEAKFVNNAVYFNHLDEILNEMKISDRVIENFSLIHDTDFRLNLLQFLNLIISKTKNRFLSVYMSVYLNTIDLTYELFETLYSIVQSIDNFLIKRYWIEDVICNLNLWRKCKQFNKILYQYSTKLLKDYSIIFERKCYFPYFLNQFHQYLTMSDINANSSIQANLNESSTNSLNQTNIADLQNKTNLNNELDINKASNSSVHLNQNELNLKLNRNEIFAENGRNLKQFLLFLERLALIKYDVNSLSLFQSILYQAENKLVYLKMIIKMADPIDDKNFKLAPILFDLLKLTDLQICKHTIIALNCLYQKVGFHSLIINILRTVQVDKKKLLTELNNEKVLNKHFNLITLICALALETCEEVTAPIQTLKLTNYWYLFPLLLTLKNKNNSNLIDFIAFNALQSKENDIDEIVSILYFVTCYVKYECENPLKCFLRAMMENSKDCVSQSILFKIFFYSIAAFFFHMNSPQHHSILFNFPSIEIRNKKRNSLSQITSLKHSTNAITKIRPSNQKEINHHNSNLITLNNGQPNSLSKMGNQFLNEYKKMQKLSNKIEITSLNDLRKFINLNFSDRSLNFYLEVNEQDLVNNKPIKRKFNDCSLLSEALTISPKIESYQIPNIALSEPTNNFFKNDKKPLFNVTDLIQLIESIIQMENSINDLNTFEKRNEIFNYIQTELNSVITPEFVIKKMDKLFKNIKSCQINENFYTEFNQKENNRINELFNQQIPSKQQISNDILNQNIINTNDMKNEKKYQLNQNFDPINNDNSKEINSLMKQNELLKSQEEISKDKAMNANTAQSNLLESKEVINDKLMKENCIQKNLNTNEDEFERSTAFGFALCPFNIKQNKHQLKITRFNPKKISINENANLIQLTTTIPLNISIESNKPIETKKTGTDKPLNIIESISAALQQSNETDASFSIDTSDGYLSENNENTYIKLVTKSSTVCFSIEKDIMNIFYVNSKSILILTVNRDSYLIKFLSNDQFNSFLNKLNWEERGFNCSQEKMTSMVNSLTEKWNQHKISTFSFINFLNLISGRNYLNEDSYPIFPPPTQLTRKHTKSLIVKNKLDKIHYPSDQITSNSNESMTTEIKAPQNELNLHANDLQTGFSNDTQINNIQADVKTNITNDAQLKNDRSNITSNLNDELDQNNLKLISMKRNSIPNASFTKVLIPFLSISEFFSSLNSNQKIHFFNDKSTCVLPEIYFQYDLINEDVYNNRKLLENSLSVSDWLSYAFGENVCNFSPLFINPIDQRSNLNTKFESMIEIPLKQPVVYSSKTCIENEFIVVFENGEIQFILIDFSNGQFLIRNSMVTEKVKNPFYSKYFEFNTGVMSNLTVVNDSICYGLAVYDEMGKTMNFYTKNSSYCNSNVYLNNPLFLNSIFVRNYSSVYLTKNFLSNFNDNLNSVFNVTSDIKTVACSNNFPIFVIGSSDCKVEIFSLNDFSLIETVDLIDEVPIDILITECWGFILVKTVNKLFLLSVNGKILKICQQFESFSKWFSFHNSEDFDFVVFIDSLNRIQFFEAYYPDRVQIFMELKEDIEMIIYDKLQCCFLVLTKSGKILVFQFDLEFHDVSYT